MFEEHNVDFQNVIVVCVPLTQLPENTESRRYLGKAYSTDKTCLDKICKILIDVIKSVYNTMFLFMAFFINFSHIFVFSIIFHHLCIFFYKPLMSQFSIYYYRAKIAVKLFYLTILFVYLIVFTPNHWTFWSIFKVSRHVVRCINH